SEVAFAAGFESIRQFNDTIRAIYALTPTQLREARPKRDIAAQRRNGARGSRTATSAFGGSAQWLSASEFSSVARAGSEPRPGDAEIDPDAAQAVPVISSIEVAADQLGANGGIPLRLAFRGPCGAAEGFDFPGGRAVAVVEEMLGEAGGRTYRRRPGLPAGAANAEV